MKHKLLRNSIFLLVFFCMSCAQQKSSGLLLGISNTQPVLIPVGTGPTVDGVVISSPFFDLNQITLQWLGTGGLDILLVEIKSLPSTENTTTFDCAITADQLLTLITTGTFPNTSGQLIIPGAGFSIATGIPVATSGAAAPILGSVPIYCGSVPIPSPVPDTFSIPLQVKVTAAIVPDPVNNPNNETGIVYAIGSITVGY